MNTVRIRKQPGIRGLASSPAATVSCRAVRIWNTVSHKKDGHMAAGRSACRFFSSSSRSPTVWGRNTSGTPPSVMVSPSFTEALSATVRPLTAVPPLEPRS